MLGVFHKTDNFSRVFIYMRRMEPVPGLVRRGVHGKVGVLVAILMRQGSHPFSGLIPIGSLFSFFRQGKKREV